MSCEHVSSSRVPEVTELILCTGRMFSLKGRKVLLCVEAETQHPAALIVQVASASEPVALDTVS